MNLVAFDTSSSATSVAIQHDEEIKTLQRIGLKQHANFILPLIQELLTEAQLTLNELNAIAYGAGPGSFTGIRVASAVAQGLAFPLNIPVIPVSSLAILAQSAFLEHGCEKIAVAVDAHMSKVYWALYQVNAQGEVELMPQAGTYSPHEIPSIENDKDNWYGVGDAWNIYREAIISGLGFSSVRIYDAQLPTAAALLLLARTKFAQGEWGSASDALPLYLL